MKKLGGYFVLAIIGSVIAVPITVASCLISDAVENLIMAKK